MLKCTDCGSIRVVWDWAAGDIVCTNCGLVLQERFIDDRVPFKEYGDYFQEPKEINQTVKNHTEGIPIQDEIVLASNEWCKDKREGLRVRKVDVAAGIHSSIQGVPVRAICARMNVRASKFWKATQGQEGKKGDCLSILKRTVYESEHIPADVAWQVIKVGSKLIDVVNTSTHAQTLRLDRLAISIMIIACDIKSVGPKRSKACKLYGISPDTVRKHEGLIQGLLEKIPRDVRPKSKN